MVNHYIYIYILSFIIGLLFLRHCQLAHRDKVEQTCNFCGEKLQGFTKLVEHHLQLHPTQTKTLLQGKEKKKKISKRRKPFTSRRTNHDEELNRSGVVNVRSAFNGDIMISRLKNPTPQDTDISGGGSKKKKKKGVPSDGWENSEPFFFEPFLQSYLETFEHKSKTFLKNSTHKKLPLGEWSKDQSNPCLFWKKRI